MRTTMTKPYLCYQPWGGYLVTLINIDILLQWQLWSCPRPPKGYTCADVSARSVHTHHHQFTDHFEFLYFYYL